VELSLFYDVSWIGEAYKIDWEKTRIGRRLIEKTGVKVNITNARTDDHQQLNMMLASGDLPDIVVVQMGDPTFSVMSESDAVLDYIPLINQYAPELIDTMGQEYWDFYKNSRGVSNFFATCAFAPKSAEKYSAFGGWCGVLAAREDIWNAYGEPDISTPEKLLAHLQDVRNRYPNLKPMLFGPLSNFSLGVTNQAGLNFFKEGFGVKAYYERPDGSILAEYNDPEWINYIYWLNQLYTQGFLTREELGGGTDQLTSMKEQGNVYMYEGGPEDLRYPPAGNPNLKYTAVPPFDKFMACQQVSLAWFTTFITKNCKNPEAAIKLISYMASTEGDRLVQWGEEGVDWEFDASGAPRYTAWRTDQVQNNQTNYNNERGNALFTMNWSDHEWMALGIVNEEAHLTPPALPRCG
jgi:putative aldouronate transport system substrate-binding protein